MLTNNIYHVSLYSVHVQGTSWLWFKLYRGGPGKFKAYVDDKDPNKGKIIRNVWKKGDMCFR